MLMSPVPRAFVSGAAGAVVLTLVHEAARRSHPDAPRMDLLGMRALRKLLDFAGMPKPPRDDVRRLALAGDLVANSLYYAVVPGRTMGETWLRGAVLGAAAGAGALTLPPAMGLGNPPKHERLATQVMTIAWYLAGGIAAAGVANAMRSVRRRTATSRP